MAKEDGMETTLRPLTLGEILDHTAYLYRKNFLLLAGISSVYAGALLLLGLAQIGVQEALRMNHMNSRIGWTTLVGALIVWPVMVIVGGYAIAANSRAVASLQMGQAATIRGAYGSILPRWGRYLGLMTFTTVVVWLPFGVLYGGYMVFVLLYAKPRGLLAHPPAANAEAMLIFGLGTIAFGLLAAGAITYAILMGLRYALAVPASVIEDLPARKAIRRSIDLSKGGRGRIFLLALLVVAIQVGLAVITQGFFVLLAIKQKGALPASLRVLQQFVAFATNTFVGPIYATGFTLFYYDQRVRKEGYDIEWMMKAAGLMAPAAELAGAAEEAAAWEPEGAAAAADARRTNE